MVCQNVREVRQCQQLLNRDAQDAHAIVDGVISRSEYGQWTWARQRVIEPSRVNSGRQECMVWAGCDDIENGALAPPGDHECHCSGNECKEMLHK